MTVQAPPGVPVYDWTYPAIAQNHDWDCSEESIRWCLFAWGRTPDDAWMESSMIAAGVVDPAVGCTDASGAGLARWVNAKYAEYGYYADNTVGVSFDDVAAEARTHAHPLAIGGAAWYHWSGVRGYDPVMDRLELANPANGWHGVYQTMSRQQWAEQGGFNLVRVMHPEAESGGGGGPEAVPPAGIDVSSHQGYVDWSAFRAAGGDFGWSKASGGAWYTNPTLAANWAGLQASALKRGAYHYAFEPSGQAYPGPGPEAEADYFLGAVAPLGLGPGDMLALDLEEGPGDLGGWALRFLERIETLAGLVPVLYTGPAFIREHGLDRRPELARYPLWLAAYQSQPPSVPEPWTQITFWQFTDRAHVPGVSTPVDGDWFNGTLDELGRLGKPGVLPPADDPYAPWRGLIGSGLLSMLEADGALPAQSRSTWLPLGQSPADIEECLGTNGVMYRWTVSTTNQGYRYHPL